MMALCLCEYIILILNLLFQYQIYLMIMCVMCVYTVYICNHVSTFFELYSFSVRYIKLQNFLLSRYKIKYFDMSYFCVIQHKLCSFQSSM